MQTEYHCTVFDEEKEYSLRELCCMCKVHAQFIHELIDEGILSPVGSTPHEYRFTAIEIKRVQVSMRLQDDLRINLPGTALVLDLLEKIEALQRSKRELEHLHALEKY